MARAAAAVIAGVQNASLLPEIRPVETCSGVFSWKKVVRREYHGVMGLVTFLFLLEVSSDLAVGENFEIDFLWRYVLGFTLLAYVLVRVLHKHTSWLK